MVLHDDHHRHGPEGDAATIMSILSRMYVRPDVEPDLGHGISWWPAPCLAHLPPPRRLRQAERSALQVEAVAMLYPLVREGRLGGLQAGTHY